jgi:hypothetical protein
VHLHDSSKLFDYDLLLPHRRLSLFDTYIDGLLHLFCTNSSVDKPNISVSSVSSCLVFSIVSINLHLNLELLKFRDQIT